jgi:hypothetical protein
MRNKVIQLVQYCMQVVIGHTMELDEFSTWYWSYPQSSEILILKTPKECYNNYEAYYLVIPSLLLAFILLSSFFLKWSFQFPCSMFGKKQMLHGSCNVIFNVEDQGVGSMLREYVPAMLLIWNFSIWFSNSIQMINATSHNDL